MREPIPKPLDRFEEPIAAVGIAGDVLQIQVTSLTATGSRGKRVCLPAFSPGQPLCRRAIYPEQVPVASSSAATSSTAEGLAKLAHGEGPYASDLGKTIELRGSMHRERPGRESRTVASHSDPLDVAEFCVKYGPNH